MKFALTIALDTAPEQVQRLQALQQGFAEVCNALAQVVQQTRVWNRVALHHMTYRSLRAQFPHMGSQMVCNAIYSVSRTCRMVFQHPHSPLHLSRLPQGQALPLLQFSDSCPVYFDRHTLSLKDGRLSMFTLDGRMHFDLTLKAAAEQAFHTHKLREIVLAGAVNGGYSLTFTLVDEAQALAEMPKLTEAEAMPMPLPIPEYIRVEESL